jgi:hypothetical protein
MRAIIAKWLQSLICYKNISEYSLYMTTTKTTRQTKTHKPAGVTVSTGKIKIKPSLCIK